MWLIMKLRVKTIDGTLFTVEIEVEGKVSSLKKSIEIQQNIAVPHQTLIFRGKILEDSSYLSKYKIVDNSFL